MEKPICRYCNNEFIQKKQGPKRIYCSQDCYMRDVRKQPTLRIIREIRQRTPNPIRIPTNHKIRKDLNMIEEPRW